MIVFLLIPIDYLILLYIIQLKFIVFKRDKYLNWLNNCIIPLYPIKFPPTSILIKLVIYFKFLLISIIPFTLISLS